MSSKEDYPRVFPADDHRLDTDRMPTAESGRRGAREVLGYRITDIFAECLESLAIMASLLESLFSLTGRKAVVTGGTRGIGQAMALSLAEAGADIILVQQTHPRRRSRHQHPNNLRRDPTTTSRPSIPHERLGRSPPSQPPHSLDLMPRPRLIHANTHPRLQRPSRKHHQRRIPRKLSSGLTVPAYAAAKGGIAQLTKALSNEWASQGVNVNAVAPGYVATDMNEALIHDEKRAESILSRIPAGRWGCPEDFKGPAGKPSHERLKSRGNSLFGQVSLISNNGQITSVKYYRVKPRWLMVKVVDENGQHGWGEATLEGHDLAVEGCLDEMIP
ncbi:hypothetical protein Lal_00008551, partial [Lupinus albus]